MKSAALVLTALAAGVFLLSGGGNSPAPSSQEPRTRPVPPLTLTPGGRVLTDYERYVLEHYFDAKVLDAAKLWFGRPASSFTQLGDAEQGILTESVTTKNGIYFRFANHEFDTPEEFALLAHELVHVREHVENDPNLGTDAAEVLAYQTQIAVKRDLDKTLTTMRSAWDGAKRYADLSRGTREGGGGAVRVSGAAGVRPPVIGAKRA